MSVIADFQVNGLNPSTVGGVNGGATAKYFPRVLGSSIGNFSAAPSASSASGQLVIPAFGEVQGQAIRVKLAGDVLAAAGTVTIDLVANTGTVASVSYGNATGHIATVTGTPALATATNWFIEATLVGSNNSGATPGLLSGYFSGSLNNANTALTAITNPPSGLDFVKGQAATPGTVMGLVARVTFGTSAAGNFARLYQFQVIAE